MLENIDTNLTYSERLANFLSIIAILLNGATVLYLIISEAKVSILEIFYPIIPDNVKPVPLLEYPVFLK